LTARLRRQRVNERLYEQVINKFGKQTPYDRSLIRQEIEAARQDVNAARSDARRDAAAQDRGRNLPPAPPPPAPRATYDVDTIITYRASDGVLVRGRVLLENVPGGTLADVRGHIERNGVLEDLYNAGIISFKRQQRGSAQLSPPTLDNVTKIDILSKSRTN